MANNKNTPPVDASNLPPEDAERAQTSFPPFWDPASHVVSKESSDGWVHAQYMGLDDSDPEFERHVFQALGEVECLQGSKKQRTAVPVKVPAGELFTVSVYATFRISRYVGKEMWFRCIGQKTANTPSGFVWDFEVKLPKGTASLMAGSGEKPALPAAG